MSITVSRSRLLLDKLKSRARDFRVHRPTYYDISYDIGRILIIEEFLYFQLHNDEYT